MTEHSLHWRQRLVKSLPTREVLAKHRWMKPVAGRLLDPQLWRLQHEAVARGVAVGTFWAFVIPFGQTLVAAVHCAFWRANIPAAAVMTMVTNPLTVGFWLWLAYQAGILVLGEPIATVTRASGDAGSWLAQFGWPTVLGMGMFAVGGAVLGYLAVKLIWRLQVGFKRRRRGRG